MARDERHLQRLLPRLRMIANGNSEVNAYRAQLSGSVKTTDAQAKQHRPLAKLEAAQSHDPSSGLDDPPDLVTARAVEVGCFIQLEDPTDPSREITGGNRPHGRPCLADLKIQRIESLSKLAVAERIAYIEPGSPLSIPSPTAVTRYSSDPSQRVPDDLQRTRARVLIGIVDVGGFDFAHPDFLKNGQTRFHSIWDQGGRSPARRRQVPFGSLLSQDSISVSARPTKSAF